MFRKSAQVGVHPSRLRRTLGPPILSSSGFPHNNIGRRSFGDVQQLFVYRNGRQQYVLHCIDSTPVLQRYRGLCKLTHRAAVWFQFIKYHSMFFYKLFIIHIQINLCSFKNLLLILFKSIGFF